MIFPIIASPSASCPSRQPVHGGARAPVVEVELKCLEPVSIEIHVSLIAQTGDQDGDPKRYFYYRQ